MPPTAPAIESFAINCGACSDMRLDVHHLFVYLLCYPYYFFSVPCERDRFSNAVLQAKGGAACMNIEAPNRGKHILLVVLLLLQL